MDISEHTSQPVTERLVQQADLILTMTGTHKMALLSQWPGAASRTFTLAGGDDISDPIGMPGEYYQACAEQIDRYLEEWVGKHPVFQTPESDTGK
ncbi:MAG: hypothetical protein R3C03_13660 [Pirellulaceae bacterium]